MLGFAVPSLGFGQEGPLGRCQGRWKYQPVGHGHAPVRTVLEAPAMPGVTPSVVESWKCLEAPRRTEGIRGLQGCG